MDASDAEAWADAGLRAIRKELRADDDESALREILPLAIRAAYAKGYRDSLEDPVPLSILDAMRRAEILRLRVPVQ